MQFRRSAIPAYSPLNGALAMSTRMLAGWPQETRTSTRTTVAAGTDSVRSAVTCAVLSFDRLRGRRRTDSHRTPPPSDADERFVTAAAAVAAVAAETP